MSIKEHSSGFAALNNAKIYYEIAGAGPTIIMIHAGVADHRQWNNEFASFAKHFRVLRYDMRGYGRSEPVEGEFSHLQDLSALLAYLHLDQPLIFIGCSMGGGLAIDFSLARPAQVAALILVGSGPDGLALDTPTPAKFAAAEKAFLAGDLDLVAEIETQIWFDGSGRSPIDVNQEMRTLAREMNRIALGHEALKRGKRLPNNKTPAFEHIHELLMPVLLIIGEHDIPYIHAAATYMTEKLPTAQKAVIADAAHLPNLDHPAEFERIVRGFLETF